MGISLLYSRRSVSRNSIGWRLEGYEEGEAIYRLENVFVQESRIPLSLPWQIEPINSNLEQVLDIGIYEGTIAFLVLVRYTLVVFGKRGKGKGKKYCTS